MEEKYIQEVVTHMEKHNKGLLHEYYITANSKKDTHILKGLKIHVYNLDREQMTPHIHIVDDNGEIEIEVSLLDWTIINVKKPQNIEPNWSNFRSIKDRFEEWLHQYHNKSDILNVFWLYELWDGENPNNTLDKYQNEKGLSIELIRYLESQNVEIDKERLQKELYATLVPLFINKHVPSFIDSVTLLKDIGLYDRFPIKDDDQDSINIIKTIYNQLKTWNINS